MKKERYEKIEAEKFKSWDEFLTFHSQNTKETYLIKIGFNTVQLSLGFIQFLNKALPFIGDQFPVQDGKTVILTNDQFYFFQLSWLQRKGELNPVFLGGQYLLKTLRADRYDFSQSFKLGLIPGNNGKRYHNLRPIGRRDYTVTPRGEVANRLEKKPEYTQEEKKEYSQIQACTYIDARLLVDAFGFEKAREEKLYGLLTHINDALFSRLMLRDCGTVVRPFDFSNREEAVSKPSVFYTRSQFRLFVEKNAELRQKEKGANEVLARLRFNPFRTLVVICSDTLESRLMADHFAKELLQEFREFARRNQLQINPDFRIPIIFYLPHNLLGSRPKLSYYTPEMRAKDCAQCVVIEKNIRTRNEKFNSQHYEFLLGLHKITPETFLDRTQKGKLLALEMLTNGYARMLFRLLRPVDNPEDDTVCEGLFSQLLKRDLIKKNDFVIGDLIMVEEFGLAQKIIELTGSEKASLCFREYDEKLKACIAKPLEDYCLLKGNPRQIAFMGLETMLRKAAQQDRWGAIRLCVKEFPSISKSLLGELLFAACQQIKHAEAYFLLQKGADTTILVNQQTVLDYAKDQEDQVMLKLLADYSIEALRSERGVESPDVGGVGVVMGKGCN